MNAEAEPQRHIGRDACSPEVFRVGCGLLVGMVFGGISVAPKPVREPGSTFGSRTSA